MTFFKPERRKLSKPAFSDAAAICSSEVWVPDPFEELNLCAKSEDVVDHKKALNMRDLTSNQPDVKTCKSKNCLILFIYILI